MFCHPQFGASVQWYGEAHHCNISSAPPPTTTDHQPPPTTTNHHQPPPTTTNQPQPTTTNQQPTTTTSMGAHTMLPDAYSVGTPNWAFWEKGWQKHCKDHVFSLVWTFFSWLAKRTFFWEGFFLWMFHIGRARHPGPGPRSFTPGQLSVEFVNVGGWLTFWDLGFGFLCSILGGS